MLPPDLRAWLDAIPEDARDRELEALFGIGLASDESPGRDLIGYHAAGVRPILHMIDEVPITEDDVFVDIGAGLGKAVLLTALLTGARSRGIEIQATLVARAIEAAARLGANASFVGGDARDEETELDDGTVFFLYLPFTGEALQRVLDRLKRVADDHPIVVCTLGLDLPKQRWLRRRDVDDFWLSIYDA
ncbi:hypothetical protein AKJ09_10740 [Labilithrix luteola]|uniref:Histone-lysine N-methyltransferase, H3 lysine-79 specific n=1 Tax=Labilithrix luteola TaxID=1391654 RepID=A0A0K1QEI1_9BACT|nr:hypothetical protein [Labilithrix luteola]AKV04077.1 hypothetical protein AKJ09_10740 [Labilithrix luteola]